jgi:mRNA-degrading endonuclease toxin of MazEF toxin-antitoxin module
MTPFSFNKVFLFSYQRPPKPGLSIDTVFLCFQIRSIDPSRLHHPETHLPNLAGQMPTHRMADIDQAIKLVLNLHFAPSENNF